MPGKRFLGLSSQQPVPQLLTVIRKPPVSKPMKEVDVDAPPLSSSDESDNDGLPTRADIPPSLFVESRQRRSPPERRVKNDAASERTPAPAERFKRTRASTKTDAGRQSGTGSQNTKKQPEVIDSDTEFSSPASKKPKKSPPSDEERGGLFGGDIFAKPAVARKYGKPKGFRSNARQKALPAKNTKRPPKESTPEPESPERQRPILPPSPPRGSEGDASPARKFKTIPDIDFGSPVKESPARKRRFKIPEDESAGLFGNDESFEESERPLFRIPDPIPDSFIGGEQENLDLTVSRAADTSAEPKAFHDLTSSPLTDFESVDPTPVCPLCRKEVDKERLDAFKASHPRMTVSNMRKFCESHKQHSARDAWLQKGYPDIKWEALDKRIARHYSLLRKILEGVAQSHYGKLFEKAVKSGRNRTLFQSDANLTPGYYGMRGLRAMTENLISEFAPLLRKRSLEDRLVAARGHTTYLQSVLVPELAVMLIMEDMSVGEEEARGILTESSDVGELLNDEIADVILSSDSDDEDDGVD